MKLYFEKQTQLLLKVIGTVVSHPSYALKGGTAINFFHSNMPRLSVDIDLAYTQINSREEFLAENDLFFKQLKEKLQDKHRCTAELVKTKDLIPKQIIISEGETDVKIEVNLVLRGTAYPIVLKESCPKIEHIYGFVSGHAIFPLYGHRKCPHLTQGGCHVKKDRNGSKYSSIINIGEQNGQRRTIYGNQRTLCRWNAKKGHSQAFGNRCQDRSASGQES